MSQRAKLYPRRNMRCRAIGGKVVEAWYAVYTRFQHEKSAASHLEKKDFEVFLPLYRAVHRWRDRKQALTLPLFPCYLFLRTAAHRKLGILQTAGVISLVESAGHACEITNGEIETLRKVCAAAKHGTDVEPLPFLRQGEKVRILGGPMAGITGIFIRARNQRRVVVSVELLRKSVSVEVGEQDIEAAREPDRFPLTSAEAQ